MTLDEFLKELKHKSFKFQLNVYNKAVFEDSPNLNNMTYFGDLSTFIHWINNNKYLPLKISSIIPHNGYLIINLYKEVTND